MKTPAWPKASYHLTTKKSNNDERHCAKGEPRNSLLCIVDLVQAAPLMQTPLVL